MTEAPRQPQPRDYLVVLFRRRWIIIQAFVVIVATVAVGTFLQKPIYQASVALLVETREPATSRYGELPVFAEALQPLEARSVETQKRLMISRVTLRETIRRLHIELTPAQLLKQTKVETFKDTDVIDVSVQDPNPEMAARIANALAEVYVEQNQQANKEATRSAGAFIEERLDAVRTELAQAEEALRTFKQHRNIVDLDEESKAHIEVLGKLEATAAETEAEVRPVEAKLEVMKEALSQQERVLVSSTQIERNPLVVELQSRLAELETQRAGELSRRTEEDPAVKAVLAQMREVRDQLDQEVATVIKGKIESVNPLHQDFLAKVADQTADLLAFQAREKGLKRAIGSHEAALSGVPSDQAQLARLTRAVSVSESVYKTLLEKLHEVRITEAMRLASARVVDPATVPEAPVKPRKALNLALAILFGLVVGLMFAALTEYLDDTLKSPDEIRERVGLPVLGHVPMIREVGGPLIRELSRRSPAVESYRMLRSNLAFTAVDQPFKMVLVTSPLPGEGKTVTAINLGIAFALDGKKVLVVDTDLRNPYVHRMFGFDRHPGLTDVLVNNVPVSGVIRPTDVEGLSVLPSGATAPNPAELLSSEKARQLFQSLKEEADILLFDSPPLLVTTDPAVLAAELDAVIMVCAADVVREHTAVQAKELLEKAKARTLGIVLNKVRMEREGYYYYYYYRYYYGGEGDQPDKKKGRRHK